jgi:hypothetical protein
VSRGGRGVGSRSIAGARLSAAVSEGQGPLRRGTCVEGGTWLARSLSHTHTLSLFLSQTDAMCFLVSRWAHTIPIADMGAYQNEWLGSVINIY